MALNTFQNDNLERSLRIQATYFIALVKTFRNSDTLKGHTGMLPPLWHPIMGY